MANSESAYTSLRVDVKAWSVKSATAG